MTFWTPTLSCFRRRKGMPLHLARDHLASSPLLVGSGQVLGCPIFRIGWILGSRTRRLVVVGVGALLPLGTLLCWTSRKLCLLSHLGLPAWLRYKLASGFGEAWTRDGGRGVRREGGAGGGGIPKGCPFGMVFIIALYLPWCHAVGGIGQVKPLMWIILSVSVPPLTHFSILSPLPMKICWRLGRLLHRPKVFFSARRLILVAICVPGKLGPSL